MGRIRVRIMRAEMRRRHEYVRAVARHPIHLRHRAHRIFQVLDHMRHVNPLERAGFERPRILVEIPHMLRGRIGRHVDPDRAGLDFPLAASDVEDHLLTLTRPDEPVTK